MMLVQLQVSQLNFRKAESIIDILKDFLNSLRSKAHFNTLWDASFKAARSLYLDEPVLPRQRKRTARYETGSSGTHYYPTEPKDVYKKLYFSALDAVLVGLRDRLEPTETTRHLRRVEDYLIGSDPGDDSIIDYLRQFYKDDFPDYSSLLLHREIFVENAKRKKVELKDFQSALDFIRQPEQTELRGIACEVVRLMKIVLALPARGCPLKKIFVHPKKSMPKF